MYSFILFLNICAAIPTWSGGANFTIKYDLGLNKLKYNVSVPTNTYFGIAYKTGMQNTDMVVFSAMDSGKVLDLWSETYTLPV